MSIAQVCCCVLLTAFAIGVEEAGAQGGVTSSIAGVVTDPGKAVVPGASVVVTSAATGTKFEALTSETGTFSVPALPAGSYTVTVSLSGFRSAAITDVRVQVGFRRR